MHLLYYIAAAGAAVMIISALMAASYDLLANRKKRIRTDYQFRKGDLVSVNTDGVDRIAVVDQVPTPDNKYRCVARTPLNIGLDRVIATSTVTTTNYEPVPITRKWIEFLGFEFLGDAILGIRAQGDTVIAAWPNYKGQWFIGVTSCITKKETEHQLQWVHEVQRFTGDMPLDGHTFEKMVENWYY